MEATLSTGSIIRRNNKQIGRVAFDLQQLHVAAMGLVSDADDCRRIYDLTGTNRVSGTGIGSPSLPAQPEVASLYGNNCRDIFGTNGHDTVSADFYICRRSARRPHWRTSPHGRDTTGRGFAKIVLRPARKGSPSAFSAVGHPFLQSTTPSSVSATRIRKQLIDYVKMTPITTRVHRQSHCPAALPHLPRRRSGSPRHLRPSGQHRSSRWSVFQV